MTLLLLVNSRLLVVKFWGSQKVIHGLSIAQEVTTPNPCVVHGPIVIQLKLCGQFFLFGVLIQASSFNNHWILDN